MNQIDTDTVISAGDKKSQQTKTLDGIPPSLVEVESFNLEDELLGSEAIVCSRGIFVDKKDAAINESVMDSFLSSYLGPRLLLAVVCILYGTNFALSSYMNQHLPPSAVAADRFFLASLILCPFLFRLRPKLALPALGSGVLCSIGFVSQSISLYLGTPASTVAFLAGEQHSEQSLLFLFFNCT